MCVCVCVWKGRGGGGGSGWGRQKKIHLVTTISGDRGEIFKRRLNWIKDFKEQNSKKCIFSGREGLLTGILSLDVKTTITNEALCSYS